MTTKRKMRRAPPAAAILAIAAAAAAAALAAGTHRLPLCGARSTGARIRAKKDGTPAAARTTLTFRRPTSETARRMFRRAGNGEGVRFNHDSAGMTNPCLRIDVPAGAAADAQGVEEDEDGGWWFPPPAAAVSKKPAELTAEDSTRKEEDGSWRVLRYRRRVGRGERCYLAVRDAALEWEFHTAAADSSANAASNDCGCDGTRARSMGIIGAPRSSSRSPSSSPSRSDRFRWRRRPHQRTRLGERGHGGYEIFDNVPWNDCGGLAEPLTGEAARSVMQIWPGGGSRPGRKLMTYSEAGFGLGFGGGGRPRLRLLPSLYAANPVAVVYDLVDQRGPDAMYTSTAYATLRGHLLSGEERVTVALRDGGGRRRGANVSGDAAACFTGTDGGCVDVEILSYSRAAPSLWGRLAWPMIGGMQDRFFRSQLDALERIAKENMEEPARPMLLRKSNAGPLAASARMD